MIGIESAIPVNRDTRMYVVNPSVGLMICRGFPRWAGASRARMMSLAKKNATVVAISTPNDATIKRLRSSPRCCISDSSLSRSLAVRLTAQG